MGEEEQNQNSTDSLTATNSSLRQVFEVISSLISFSHSIKVFTVKWQLIRKKLEELSSGLMAVKNCDSNQHPAVFSGLVPSVLATVNECHNLARSCVDLSYSGKLLMQSDLDVMIAKFDSHLKNLSGFYTVGILSQGFAIVVSRPGLGACKDDMRFYIGDLLTRMKIGDIDMKRQSLVNLYQVVDEDEPYVKLVVEVGDLVNVLVRFIDSPEMEIQEEASKIVSLISGFELCKEVLVGSGIIGRLVGVLENGSDLAYGGVTAILKICSSVEYRGELIGLACGLLRNLVGVEEIKRFIVEEGAIEMFIKLVRSRQETVQINSIEFLQNIASGDESVRQMVVTSRLCGTSEEAKKAMGDAGFMPELVKLIDAKSYDVSEMATEALSNLISVPKNRKQFVQDDLNIMYLLQLLYQEEGMSGN
ncbi:vesicle-associated protein 4-2-like [Hibiscus syriacus]|uniref:Vesicle-associated protein 4-2-like n=1 Tax=Hibiscus syriacus TaxID=106335 RepID=A0A6A3BWM2_HIBSY|nr:vesicle-associated protein 4-2-like [Hibiscus syriacus]